MSRSADPSPEAAELLALARQDYQRHNTPQAARKIAAEISGRRAESRIKAADTWHGRASRT